MTTQVKIGLAIMLAPFILAALVLIAILVARSQIQTVPATPANTFHYMPGYVVMV